MNGDAAPRLDGRYMLVVEDQYLVADEMRRMIAAMGARYWARCRGRPLRSRFSSDLTLTLLC